MGLSLFLVRHGDAEHNVLAVASSLPEKEAQHHLTELGRAQIASVACALVSESIDCIFYSPLVRTKETAEIIREQTRAPCFEDFRLCELEYGRFNGGPWKDFMDKYPPRSSRLIVEESDGVESFFHAWDRLLSFCDELVNAYDGKRVVIVSHGDVLRMLHSMFTGITVEESAAIGRRFHRGEMLRMEVSDADLIALRRNAR